MEIDNLIPIYFDIETSGLTAEDDFVCATTTKASKELETFGFEFQQVTTSLKETMRKIKEMYSMFNFVLVTYNGENRYQGFDFPWLRTKCIKEGVEWQLSGVKHLDLYPLVDCYIQTKHYELPSKSDLYKKDLVKLAEANGFEYENKTQAYGKLEEIEEVDWLDYEMKAKDDASLQAVYQMLFDPEQEEEYISGEKIPKLYEKLQRLDDNMVDFYTEEYDKCNEIWQEIQNHNRRDVERLKKVAEKVIPVLPDWEIERNINKL